MYKLFLTLRYLRKGRIAYFAIGAVTLCVAMVLVVLSVMGGWLDMVKNQARGLLGDIVIDNRSYSGFPLYQEFIDEISQWPEVVKATPVIYTVGLYHFPSTDQTGTVSVVGIHLQDVYDVNAFKRSLFYEKYYPGTTTLADQGQPLLGFDENGISVTNDFGQPDTLYIRSRLPEPYQSALDQARKEYAEPAKQEGIDPTLRAAEEVPTQLSEILTKHGRPPVPGLYMPNPDGAEPTIAGPEFPGMIVGRELVAKRESDGRYDYIYARGEQVNVTLWATTARGAVDPVPKKQSFRYADDSRTGIFEIDSKHIYCDFDYLQDLIDMEETLRVDPLDDEKIIGTSPGRCSQIQIKVAPGVDARALTARMEKLYLSFLENPRFDLDLTERRLISSVKAMTWEESQAAIIGPVEKEKMLLTILFAIISAVAIALILCILYMIVLQKTRDIGIIKAIGGSPAGLALIFITYGAAVGITGAILGLGFGSLFVTYINEVQDFLIAVNPDWRVWDLEVYSFDHIPNVVHPQDALMIGLFALVAATLGSLAAALRAGFMEPVGALSHE